MGVEASLVLLFVVVSIFSSGGEKKDSKDASLSFSPRYTQSVKADTSQQDRIARADVPKSVLAKNETQPSRSLKYAGQDDYQIISSYIIGYYKKIPLNEAEIIADRIVKYAREYKLDPKFVTALIAKESAFNRRAVSVSNAKGLGQIMEFNYPNLGIQDPFDIDQNVKGCVKLIASLLDKWEGKEKQVPLALASYNEGYGAICRSNECWKPSTDNYIEDILKTYQFLKTEF